MKLSILARQPIRFAAMADRRRLVIRGSWVMLRPLGGGWAWGFVLLLEGPGGLEEVRGQVVAVKTIGEDVGVAVGLVEDRTGLVGVWGTREEKIRWGEDRALEVAERYGLGVLDGINRLNQREKNWIGTLLTGCYPRFIKSRMANSDAAYFVLVLFLIGTGFGCSNHKGVNHIWRETALYLQGHYDLQSSDKITKNDLVGLAMRPIVVAHSGVGSASVKWVNPGVVRKWTIFPSMVLEAHGSRRERHAVSWALGHRRHPEFEKGVLSRGGVRCRGGGRCTGSMALRPSQNALKWRSMLAVLRRAHFYCARLGLWCGDCAGVRERWGGRGPGSFCLRPGEFYCILRVRFSCFKWRTLVGGELGKKRVWRVGPVLWGNSRERVDYMGRDPLCASFVKRIVKSVTRLAVFVITMSSVWTLNNTYLKGGCSPMSPADVILGGSEAQEDVWSSWGVKARGRRECKKSVMRQTVEKDRIGSATGLVGPISLLLLVFLLLRKGHGSAGGSFRWAMDFVGDDGAVEV
ncbi:hypothetical protein Tco_0782929 [Tanacetum coccineum]